MAQVGDPNTKDLDADPTDYGSGGPGYTIADEFDRPDARKHFAGSLSMAKTPAPDTGGSQFFMTTSPTGFLDGRHTVFGRIVEGMDLLQSVTQINPGRPRVRHPPGGLHQVRQGSQQTPRQRLHRREARGTVKSPC